MMNEFYMEIEVGDASPLSFFSSLTASFLMDLSFSRLSPAVFLRFIVWPFYKDLFIGDGVSSSTFVGDFDS